MDSNITTLINLLATSVNEINEVRGIAQRLSNDCNQLTQEVTTLKKENNALQLFIEANVDEEKKKEIFKD